MVDLARWVTSIVAIPPRVRQSVVNVVADAVAAAAAGSRLLGSTAAQRAALSFWGYGSSSIWFTGQKAPPQAATFANAMSTSILDIDDGHRAATGHPGSAIVTAVLAFGEDIMASDDQIITAIAIGYETGIRYSACRNIREIDTAATGRWCGVGVVAAVGWLNGDDVITIAHAMAIAGAIAPHNMASEGSGVGHDIKEAIPFGAADGYMSLASARAGMTGPLDILDRECFNENVLTGGDGETWYIETTYFKLYSCCRWIHAPIDAVLKIGEEFSDWAAVKEILVETFQATMRLPNQPRPGSLQAAQYSSQFCIAAAAIHGARCLQPLSESLLTDDKVLTLAAKINLRVDQELDKAFPRNVPGRVTVRTIGEPIVVEVATPRGETSNPLSWDEHMQKLWTLAMPALGRDRTLELEEALVSLSKNRDFKLLFNFLSASDRKILL
ncbi:MmgE/PrpD family protein [Agrobacterium tumefaciens]|nr:MmgE/PrpD family protein [Agrobacterium tumefaciens]